MWNYKKIGRKHVILASVMLINFLLILYTSQITLRNFQNSADEHIQYLTAQMFANGKLTVPAPNHSEFFKAFHLMIENGRAYGVFPAGWPLFLSIGMLFNAPWLVNPIFGTLTLLLVFLIAVKHFSKRVAIISITITLFNPFFIFNSASYFTHPTALLFVTLFVYFYMNCLDNPNKKSNYLMMGLASGFAFLARPFTATVVIVPLGVYLIYFFIKSKNVKIFFKNCMIPIIVFSFFLTFYLWYNDHRTGSPFLDPEKKLYPCVIPLSSKCPFGISKALEITISRIELLNLWMPIVMIFVFFYIFKRRKTTKEKILLLIPAFLIGGYFVDLVSAGNQYGPRFWYESFSALILITALGVNSFKKKKVIAGIIAIFLIFNIGFFYYQISIYGPMVIERTEIFDLAKKGNLTNAIVFLKTGSGNMNPPDLIRNSIYFNQSVLYVYDLGDKNTDLIKDFPDRTYYYWIFDSSTQKGLFVPYTNFTVNN